MKWRLPLALIAGIPVLAHADDEDRIARLERRVAELEARAEAAEAHARDLEAGGTEAQSERERDLPVSISGSARLGWYDGGEYASVSNAGARIWDARVFVDAELAEDVRSGAQTLARNVGFTFEWNLVRRGHLSNDVGELYVDFQGVGGSSWMNLRPGRFQIPVGEEYKRYSRGESSNPFITHSLGGPWFWDEGVMLYGSSEQGDLGYVASVANGSTAFNLDADSGAQYTAKVWAQPTNWLYASASGLYQGKIGADGSALWLGETWATPVGALSGVPTWIDGAIAPPSYAPFDSGRLAGGDLVLTPIDGIRAWLGGGRYALESRDGSLYDRALHYWIAELMLRGGLLHPALVPATLGLRADRIATDSPDRGYLLSIDFADDLGYNMQRFTAYSLVLGWQLDSGVAIRAEYSLRDIDLVRGASSLQADARDIDEFALEVGVRF
jgi:hypothetical protein